MYDGMVKNNDIQVQDQKFNNVEQRTTERKEPMLSVETAEKYQQIMFGQNQEPNNFSDISANSKSQPKIIETEFEKKFTQTQSNQNTMHNGNLQQNTVDILRSGNIPQNTTDILRSDNIPQNKQDATQIQDLSSIFSSLLSQSDLLKPNQIEIQNALDNTQIQNSGPNTTLPSDIEELANSIISKIQTSDPANSAGSEVRLTMSNNTVIEGTEIILKRATDGALSVVIVTQNENQFKKVNEAKDRLEEALQKHEKGMINISVEMTGIY